MDNLSFLNSALSRSTFLLTSGTALINMSSSRLSSTSNFFFKIISFLHISFSLSIGPAILINSSFNKSPCFFVNSPINSNQKGGVTSSPQY